MKAVLVTGGFDPIHSGHIEYFKSAKKLGAKLIVGLNSDEWLEKKKGRSFMPWPERAKIINELEVVDQVIGFNDDDNTACNAIELVLFNYPQCIFANGGDRTNDNIPEIEKYKDNSNVEFIFGVGGEDKKNSSSWILDRWKAPKTERPWGYYRVLHEDDGVKVKELTVNPGKSLSLQRHEHRSEYWLVSHGEASVEYQRNPKWNNTIEKTLQKHEDLVIPQQSWHRLSNKTQQPLKIIEIQYGEQCIEEDIERK